MQPGRSAADADKNNNKVKLKLQWYILLNTPKYAKQTN